MKIDRSYFDDAVEEIRRLREKHLELLNRIIDLESRLEENE